MKKGITPVIAIILLLLITIAMVGFAFVWFSRVADIASNSTQQQLQNQLNLQGKKITIVNIDSANRIITINNFGTQPIQSSELGVVINGTFLTQAQCTFSPSPIPAGQFSSCTFNANVFSGAVTTCPAGIEIKVSAPGNFDTRDC